MFGNMMGKLQEMQQKTEEIKKRLETISVHAEAEGLVKVTANGNKKITSIEIDESIIKEGDKEQIEDLCILAVNRAIEKADEVFQSEMQGAAKGMLPGMM
ncbi:MAG: YbaB/EbfC family nucleoid-associated protein [Vicingaceae bacterium]